MYERKRIPLKERVANGELRPREISKSDRRKVRSQEFAREHFGNDFRSIDDYREMGEFWSFERLVGLEYARFDSAKAGRHQKFFALDEKYGNTRQVICDSNIGLPYSIFYRFNKGDDDSLSEAFFGLVRSIDGFNPFRGFRFSTYACNVIVRALYRQYNSDIRYRERFVSGFELFEGPQTVKPVSDMSGVVIESMEDVIRRNAADLTALEKRVIKQRFPLGQGGEALTLREVGEAVGLSKERVRQIQNIALEKLRGEIEENVESEGFEVSY